MATKVTIKDDYQNRPPVVGNLRYGTFLTGIIGHPDSVYIKVDKREHNKGVAVCVPSGHSALLNIKTGQIRAVSGSTECRVLDADITLTLVPRDQVHNFVK